MRTLEIDTGYDKVYLFGDKVYQGHDFFVKANAPLSVVELVLFFDSRGISKDWDSSLLKMLLAHFKSKKYLVIARPLELTTWATLYSFFQLNRLTPELLITNVGIVDFTPKKYSLCESMVEQVRCGFEVDNSVIEPLESYLLSNGNEEMLYSVVYPEQCKDKLNDFFLSTPTVAIKTPLVDKNIRIERKRPSSFFTQIDKTNNFIGRLECDSIDLGLFDHHLTYDAVHWTQKGNQLVFDKIIGHV